ncbi:MAG TPA: ferritin-like domain-containing protein [Lichenihabitans sp.]|jgi:hypothetical protein|nr:ferritin-like domain-containing protein [Lichenihabitans sp.]
MDNDKRFDTEEGAAPRTIDMAAGRRAFMRTSGLAAAGAAIFGATGANMAEAQSADLDQQILNFALNLEYLEAEFYLHAAFGRGLADTDIGGNGRLGGVTGGRQVQFQDPTIAAYANEIATDEENHVKYLRSALKGARVARPTIDIQNSFTTAAIAAGLISQGQTFDPYADDVSFVLGAYIFEDVGVTAYSGAVSLITNKNILQAAAGVLAVEAYHAGLVRTVLFAKGAFQQTAAISALRATLAGLGNDDQGVGPDQSTISGGAATQANIVPTDQNSLAFYRTPRQVLNIVYGQTGARQGLFFPDGTNGFFRGQG